MRNFALGSTVAILVVGLLIVAVSLGSSSGGKDGKAAVAVTSDTPSPVPVSTASSVPLCTAFPKGDGIPPCKEPIQVTDPQLCAHLKQDLPRAELAVQMRSMQVLF